MSDGYEKEYHKFLRDYFIDKWGARYIEQGFENGLDLPFQVAWENQEKKIQSLQDQLKSAKAVIEKISHEKDCPKAKPIAGKMNLCECLVVAARQWLEANPEEKG